MLLTFGMQSKNIFLLIDEVCGENPEVIYHFDEKSFQLFAELYTELAAHREEQLRQYLREKDFYRTFMPVCSFTFNSINDVIWYYNEVLLCDPVLYMLNDPTMQLRGKQTQVVEAIKALLNLRSQIETGYVLLTCVGSGINFESFTEDANNVLQLPSVSAAFEGELVVRKQPSVLPSGEDLGLVQLMGQYHGWSFTWHPTSLYIPDTVEASVLSKGVTYSFQGRFQRVSRAELKRMGKEAMFTRGWFTADAKQVIGALHCSTELDMPVQYFRHVDFSVAEAHAIGFGDPFLQTKIDKREVIRTILPFVKGIEPVRLMQVREEMPEVFRQFRELFFTLTLEAKDKGIDENSLQEWVRSKVNSEKKYLEREMRNLLRKSKYDGTSAQRNFCKASLAQPISAPYKTPAHPELKKHPMYYLWKAGG